MTGRIHKYQFSWFDWFCLWYPPGWLIIFNRHWQHYYDDPDGWKWWEYWLFLIPGGFYLALLMRWVRLGFRSPKSQDRKFDPDYQQAFVNEVIGQIVTSYFQAELESIENLPIDGSLIVAINHAGMCFPWDFLALAYLLNQHQGWQIEPLAHLALFNHPWMLWWFPPDWANVLGAIPANTSSLEVALKNQRIVLYAPEGVRGPGKGWNQRYQLQKFDPSFIRLSQRYQIPILPIICLGSENLHPFAFNMPKVAHKLQLPVFPVSGLMIWFGLFPSMGVWAAKTHLRYYMEPILDFSTKKFPLSTSQAYRQAQKLRSHLQVKIDKIKEEGRGGLGRHGDAENDL
ncbi:1-acyl-sn-glycerol-3-phosphate acyltransferase [Merismopedia glauca]|uniref:1-acyl-sn-glycerol-3-phosphate acyltransferase n=1 Tax=Merismopedia glauca TaxID=292586 RepID=UPI001FE8A2A5|nr:1-acyl-sn-glycerol-3-phosphate acyltransferase [Merismopedia glauca]